jgi:hypothetical protein
MIHYENRIARHFKRMLSTFNGEDKQSINYKIKISDKISVNVNDKEYSNEFSDVDLIFKTKNFYVISTPNFFVPFEIKNDKDNNFCSSILNKLDKETFQYFYSVGFGKTCCFLWIIALFAFSFLTQI